MTDKCPRCNYKIGPEPPQAIVERVLEEARYERSAFRKLLNADDFWAELFTGRFLPEMSRTGHLVFFITVWPTLLIFAIVLPLVFIGDVILTANTLLFTICTPIFKVIIARTRK